MSKAIYYINGKNFKDFGVFVSDSFGVLGLPKMRKPKSHVWEDYNGEVIDLKAKYYEPRNIRLQCFMEADGELDFASKMTAFCAEFCESGTSRLLIDVIPGKPLIYEVFLSSPIDPEKEWEEGQMVATFSLTLIEAEPLKKVLKVAGSSVSLSGVAPKVLTIHWGDGRTAADVGGDMNLSHNYSSVGPHYIVIAGGVAEIENLDTNAEEIWSRL